MLSWEIDPWFKRYPIKTKSLLTQVKDQIPSSFSFVLYNVAACLQNHLGESIRENFYQIFKVDLIWLIVCSGRHKCGIKCKTDFKEGDMSQNTHNFLLSLKFRCHSEKPMRKTETSNRPWGLSLYTCNFFHVLTSRNWRERKSGLTLGTHFQPFHTDLAFPVEKYYLCQLLPV